MLGFKLFYIKFKQFYSLINLLYSFKFLTIVNILANNIFKY